MGAYLRDFMTLVFSLDESYIYAGSASGDISCINVRSRVLAGTVKACSGGVLSITELTSGGLIVGGGDGTILYLSGSGKDFVPTKKLKIHAGGITSISLNSDSTEFLTGTTEVGK